MLAVRICALLASIFLAQSCQIHIPSPAEIERSGNNIVNKNIKTDCVAIYDKNSLSEIYRIISEIETKHATTVIGTRIIAVNVSCIPSSMLSAFPDNTIAIDTQTIDTLIHLSTEQQYAVLCHEIAHISLAHWRRRLINDGVKFDLDLKVSKTIVTDFMAPSTEQLVGGAILSQLFGVPFFKALNNPQNFSNLSNKDSHWGENLSARIQHPFTLNGFPSHFEMEADIEAMRCLGSVGVEKSTYKKINYIAELMNFYIPTERLEAIDAWLNKVRR